MYYAEYKKNEPDSKVAILLKDLVKAKERGVSVSVILDRTAIFIRKAIKGKQMEIEGKNVPAFYFLKRHGVDPVRSKPLQAANAVPSAERTSNGVNVKFDSMDIYTHGKCIVIDSETVILGQAIIGRRILTEMPTGNYDNFSKDFDSNMKESLNKDKFQTDTKKISDEIGKYISKEYLGYFNKGEMTMVIWKGKFDKTGDDVLIKVVLSKSGDKNYITGLWFE